MKKTLLVVAIIAGTAPLCFAQTGMKHSAMPAKPAVAAVKSVAPAGAKVDVKAFSGVVEDVVMGVPAKGTETKVNVMADGGAKLALTAKPTTLVIGKDAKMSSLDKLVKGEKVKGKYVVGKSGTNEAISFSVVGQ